MGAGADVGADVGAAAASAGPPDGVASGSVEVEVEVEGATAGAADGIAEAAGSEPAGAGGPASAVLPPHPAKAPPATTMSSVRRLTATSVSPFRYFSYKPMT
ncbi:hypothetical protein ACFWP2_21180 [Kitasatospora sp. NPDC058444]|uniref:hypothetical protein n=1 Tax=Kitasatospora sp. NPDC058444 TaxID=3346504 RepID=UPI0036560472